MKNYQINIISLFLIILINVSPLNTFASTVEQYTVNNVAQDLSISISDVKTATTYSWGVVGTPSKATPAENAARVLFKNANEKTLTDLRNGATTEGQMYVLCVLKRKYPKIYRKEIMKTDYSSSQVSIFTGSILSRTSAKNILRQIEKHNCSALSWGK